MIHPDTEAYWKSQEALIDANGFSEIDFAQIDRDLYPEFAEPVPISSRETADALKLLLEGLIPSKPLSVATPAAIGYRVISLLWLLQSQHRAIGERSLASIAEQLDISRALLSYYVRVLEDSTGLHGRGQKLSTTVATYRAVALKAWSEKPMAIRKRMREKKKQAAVNGNL